MRKPIYMLLVVLFFCYQCKNENDQKTLPNNPESKYIIIDEERLEQLRISSQTTHADIWNQINGFVENVRTGNDGQIAAEPPSQPPGETNQNFFRDHGDAMGAMALSALISEDSAHISLAKGYLMAMCNWDVWDIPRNDLGHIHMIIGVSFAFNWLQDYLTGEEKQFISEKLGYWVQDRYKQATQPYNTEWNNWWKESYIQNHCGSNYAAIGIAALVLQDQDSRSSEWLDLAIEKWERIQFLLNSIGDGSWHEGVTYQWYQFETALPFLFALKQKTGKDLLPDVQLKSIVTFWVYNKIHNNHQWMLPYGDVSVWETGHSAPPAMLRMIASAYQESHAEWVAQQLLQASGRHPNVWAFPYVTYEFLFYNPDIQPEPPDISSHSLSHFFTDAEALVWRSSWNGNAIVFGIKSGAYGGRFAFENFHNAVYPFEESNACANVGHDHRDAGSIWIAHASGWLLPEDVQYEGYETSLHNTLLIDDEGQAIYTPGNPNFDGLTQGGERYDAGVKDIAGDHQYYEYIETDLTNAYKHISGINKIKRYVLYIRPNAFFVIDQAVFSGEKKLSHMVHATNSISKESDWLKLTSESGLLGIQLLNTDPADVAISATAYGMPQASINIQSMDIRMVNFYYTLGNNSWTEKSQANTIESTTEGIALNLTNQDGSSVTIFLNTTGSGTSPDVAPITLDSQILTGRLMLHFFNTDGTLIHSVEY